MSHIDPELRDALDRQGEGVRVVADLAERAIARDRSNRRRELGAALLGAGLVLAVALPVTVASLHREQGTTIPAGPTQPTQPTASGTTGSPVPGSTSPTATTPAVPAPPTSIPTLRPTGAAGAASLRPASGPVTATTDVGYVVDGTYHQGGTTIRLPADLRVTDYVARLGDGLLVSGPDGHTIVHADGTKGAVIAASQQRPRVGDDGTHLLANDADGNLLYADSVGATVATLKPRSTGDAGYSPAGLVGTTAYASRPGTGSSIAWDVETGALRSLKGELAFVNAPSGLGLSFVGGDTGGDGSKSCQMLLDLASGREIWRLCGPLQMLGFSDDGQYALATGHVDGFTSWLFGSLVVIRTSDAAIVLQGGGPAADAKGDVKGVRMTADHRLTLQVWNGDTRDLEQCSLDGACEVVGAARPLPNPDVPESAGPYPLQDN
ncbi:hypothetical protein [Terrabacter sp. 2RAF25]|uniref:hypothetical protein n=1 Tax=Terrabacter sp. 2RAF25 TaxID=3232998 RepID=UPI003F98DA92